METKLQKFDELEAYIKEQARTYINSPEKFADALVFSKKLEDLANQIKDSVKERGSRLMEEQDLKEIEFGEWVVKKIDPTETTEYHPNSVLKALGPDVAQAFMKVSTSKLENWVRKSRLEGEILGQLNQDKRVKLRKGYVRLDQKKDKQDKSLYIK